MKGIVEESDTVKLSFGYYDCHAIERGDVVAFENGSNPTPLIKQVRAIPGDRFGIGKNTSGVWNLLINGTVAKTITGIPYAFLDGGERVLGLYEKSYSGVVPHNAYMLLGTASGGSVDSTRFGLVGREDIVAKVTMVK